MEGAVRSIGNTFGSEHGVTCLVWIKWLTRVLLSHLRRYLFGVDSRYFSAFSVGTGSSVRIKLLEL